MRPVQDSFLALMDRGILDAPDTVVLGASPRIGASFTSVGSAAGSVDTGGW